jgi:hypothetical protein
MTAAALKPRTVRCMCGWAGLLGSKTPCPACRRAHTHRIDGARADTLEALQRGEQPVIWPIVREWLLWARLIVPISAKTSPSETRLRRPPRRLFAITEAGRRAIGVAADQRGAEPQEASAP